MDNKQTALSYNLKTTPLKRKIVLFGLQTTEFRSEIERAAREIRNRAKPNSTEATIEGHFERVLYAALREIGLAFSPEKEAVADTRRHTAKARMDSRLGALVIEYKRPSQFKTIRQVEKAIDQLSAYLLSLNGKGAPPTAGFLTDGRSYCELTAKDGAITSRSPRLNLDGDALHRSQVLKVL